MQNNFSDCLAFAVIRNALGQEIDLVDRDIIVREEEYEGFCISVPTDLAYTKSAIGVCKMNNQKIHEIVAYKPN